MRIRTLKLQKFMSHASTELDLPAEGLVVVTGPNGAGKSSLVEAVATAAWGKTLRGSTPWSSSAFEQEECKAVVTAEGLLVARERSRGKVKLYWRLLDDGTETGTVLDSLQRMGAIPEAGTDNPRFESAKQGQAALERVIGPFDVWRRSCAFSSSDAAHFSLASDGERKRLLETILGLDAFDAALEACREELRAAERAVGDAGAQEKLSVERLNAERRRLGDAEAEAERAKAELPELLAAPSPEDIKRLSGAIDKLNDDVAKLKRRVRDTDREAYDAEAKLRGVEAELARLKNAQCAACGQALPAAPTARAIVAMDDARVALKAATERASKLRSAVEAELSDLEAEVAEAVVRYSDMRAARRDADERAEARRRAAALAARAAENVQKAAQRVQEAQAAVDAAEVVLRAAEKRVAIETAVEVVLGLRGVRAHVLARSLSGLSAVANAWLPRLGLPGLAITLKPYSEKKTGGVTDAISVEIAGAGGGHGYRGASAGERRRVDLALLLGISEVAAAASSRTGSTLFFDEVFDALDADGVKAVSTALGELARDRCVVVVTHNAELAKNLPAVAFLNVEGGRVSA